ncbi:hypothetical protein D3C76_1857810 [compost metagenome]
MIEAQENIETDNAQSSDSGNQQAETPSQQGIADGHRDDQEIANGAGDTAGGVEQAAEQ